MRTEYLDKTQATPAFTPEKILDLLVAAEYFMATIEMTPKEHIMDMGCPDAEGKGEVVEMPLVDCHKFKFLAGIVTECRCLVDKGMIAQML
jgi:hypothetical protein